MKQENQQQGTKDSMPRNQQQGPKSAWPQRKPDGLPASDYSKNMRANATPSGAVFEDDRSGKMDRDKRGKTGEYARPQKMFGK